MSGERSLRWLLGAGLAVVLLLARGQPVYGAGALQPVSGGVLDLDGLGQQFRADRDGLSTVEVCVDQVRWRPGAGRATATLRLYPLPQEGQRPLRTSTVALEAPALAGPLEFPFPAVDGSGGREFLAEWQVSGGASVWVSAAPQDAYPDGAAVLRGAATGQDLVFRTRYQPRLGQMLLAGAAVAAREARPLGVTAAVLAASAFALGALLTRRGFPRAVAWAAAPGAALALLALLGFAAALARVQPATTGLLAVGGLAIAAGVWLRGARGRASQAPSPDLSVAAPLALFIASLALFRLAYLSDLALPPYADSARHSRIIADLMQPSQPPLAFYRVDEMFSGRYYHLGAHSLTAWLATAASAEPHTAFAVTLQLLQALIPLPVFALVHALTGDRWAGLAAAVAAGVGWAMPAHASNWGKFPALMSFTILPALLALGVALARSGRWRSPAPVGLAALVAAGTVLVHTRMAVVLGVVMLSATLTAILPPPRLSLRRPAHAAGVAVALAALALVLFQTGELQTVGSRYLQGSGIAATLTSVLLLPLALRAHPRASLATAIAALTAAVFSLVPIPGAPTAHLVDRPFLDVGLYLPLSLLLGFGLSGLRRLVDGRPVAARARTVFGPAALAAGLAALLLQPVGADPCCILAGEGDVGLMRDLRGGLERRDLVAVAADRWSPDYLAPVDGGAWLPALVGVRIRPVERQSPLEAPATFENLCRQGVRYLYVGTRAESFSRLALEARPSWYAPSRTGSGAALYRLAGCEDIAMDDS